MLKILGIIAMLGVAMNPQASEEHTLSENGIDSYITTNRAVDNIPNLRQLETDYKETNTLFKESKTSATYTTRIPDPISKYEAPYNSLSYSLGFDPGFLISDEVFLNKNSMTSDGIQSFLEYVTPECRSVDLDCLKDFRLDIPNVSADDKGICTEIASKENVSAAEAIKTVSDACGINPQVILTHLEKEQGLVSSSSPTSYMYRAAMGFNCPDSNPQACGSVSGGFWNQIYGGSKQKLWYGNENSIFQYYPVGEPVRMKYHPNAECGTQEVVIKNRATASLYYYTPYVPNSAAMSNMSGLGDNCSSYGNRNFFKLFNEWFGDSRTSYSVAVPGK